MDLKRWKKLERKKVREYGGICTPNSGALWGQKCDAYSPDFKWRIECKCTTKSTFRLRPALFRKLLLDCKESGGTPLLVVHFKTQRRDVVVVPEYCFPKNDYSVDTNMNTIGPYTTKKKLIIDKDTYIVVSGSSAKIGLRLAK